MANTIPLAIYWDGKREVVGEAVFLEDGQLGVTLEDPSLVEVFGRGFAEMALWLRGEDGCTSMEKLETVRFAESPNSDMAHLIVRRPRAPKHRKETPY